MDTNFSLFNQINSICYWLLVSSDYRSSVILDAESDSYSVSLKKSGVELYANCITDFSQKDPNFLETELTGIASGLLRLKKKIEKRK